MRDIYSDPRMRALLHIETELEIAPVAAWPHGFAAWVPHMMVTLKASRNKRVQSSAGRKDYGQR